jgi:hypothetical protein
MHARHFDSMSCQIPPHLAGTAHFGGRQGHLLPLEASIIFVETMVSLWITVQFTQPT